MSTTQNHTDFITLTHKSEPLIMGYRWMINSANIITGEPTNENIQQWATQNNYTMHIEYKQLNYRKFS